MPRYASARTDFDAEDLKFDFKSGQQPSSGSKTYGQPKTKMSNPNGCLPDEFHNTEYERVHPELIQPAHYDKYDPQVEGFFGAGYSFEPMERAHHKLQEEHQPYGGYTRFTPGHFAAGDLEHSQDYHQASHEFPTYHEEYQVRDLDEPSRVEDDSARMDIYMPTYSTPMEAYKNPYAPAYAKAALPRDYPMKMQPEPTTAQDPFT